MADITREDRKREKISEAEEILEKTNKNLGALNKSIEKFSATSTKLSWAMILLAAVSIVLMVLTNLKILKGLFS